MKLAKTCKSILILTAAFVGLNTTTLAYAGATYVVDSIYDNVNSNYLGSTPTLTQGETYDLFIVSYGDDGILEDTTNTLWQGAAVNWYTNPVFDFNNLSLTQVLDTGISAPVPYPGHDQGYLFTGSFTVPGDATIGTRDGLVWAYEGLLPDDIKKFDINVEAATAAVPEPATMAMVSLGLVGGFYRRLKNS